MRARDSVRLDADALRELVSSLGVEASVWLPGSLDDVPSVLRAFDVFVLPSLAEGVSNTILEAMASGLPVIATAVGANAELVQAFNAYARYLGLDDIYDGMRTHDAEGWKEVLKEIVARWAVLKEHCDEFGDDEHDPDCYECREIKEAGWWLDWSAGEQAEGAFPIMVVTL